MVLDTFDAIKDDFTELRDFFVNDLRILLQSPIGGNYAAVLVTTTACEVLGPLRFENNGERTFFREYLVPNAWRPLAGSLYDALRNGLAHSYATKTIVNIDGLRVELGISWQEKPHLRFDSEASTVYINVRELVQTLILGFETYENELKSEQELCERFRMRREKKRIVNVPDAERQAWKKLVSSQVVGA